MATEQNEKSEKGPNEKPPAQNEKEEKYTEKSAGWTRDSLSSTIWALALIWAGIVFLIISLDIPFFIWARWTRNAWGIILIGISLLLGLEIAIRLAIPKYAAPLRGRIILAVVLGFMGISNLTDIQLLPLILIGLGIYILFGALKPNR